MGGAAYVGFAQAPNESERDRRKNELFCQLNNLVKTEIGDHQESNGRLLRDTKGMFGFGLECTKITALCGSHTMTQRVGIPASRLDP